MTDINADGLPQATQKALNSIYDSGFADGKKQGFAEGYKEAIRLFTTTLDKANTKLEKLTVKTPRKARVVGKTVRDVNPNNPNNDEPVGILDLPSNTRSLISGRLVTYSNVGVVEVHTIGDIPNAEYLLKRVHGCGAVILERIRAALAQHDLTLPDVAPSDGQET